MAESGCTGKKTPFLFCHHDETPGRDHEQNWLVAKGGLAALRESRPLSPAPSDETCDGPFQTLLETPFKAVKEDKMSRSGG